MARSKSCYSNLPKWKRQTLHSLRWIDWNHSTTFLFLGPLLGQLYRINLIQALCGLRPGHEVQKVEAEYRKRRSVSSCTVFSSREDTKTLRFNIAALLLWVQKHMPKTVSTRSILQQDEISLNMPLECYSSLAFYKSSGLNLPICSPEIWAMILAIEKQQR